MPLVRGNSVVKTTPSVRSSKQTGSSKKTDAEPRAAAPVCSTDPKNANESSSPPPLKDSPAPVTHDVRLRPQLQHTLMLESMDRKARELCEDTRRQYELLLARAEAQHERQQQTLQHKLKEVVSTSIPLDEHRQALSDLARGHDRDTRALVQAHDEETTALRLRYKQIASEQLLQRSRAFQDEKDQLLETMTQLEMDRNAALRQWREEELVALSLQKELQDAHQAHERTQYKLREACQHIVTLKSQLSKIDRVAKKLKDERAAHVAGQTQWQTQLTTATNTIQELRQRVSVLETELTHARESSDAREAELTSLKYASVGREAQANEIQRALAESIAKETMLREFRDTERVAHEQQRMAWRDLQTKLEAQEAEKRKEVALLQQEKQVLDAQCQRLTQDLARSVEEKERREVMLTEKLRRARVKYAALKQRVKQLETSNAELQDEERVHSLLFASRR